MLVWMAVGAFADDGVRVPMEEVTIAARHVTGMAVRGVEGEVEVVGDDGDTVRASGSACGPSQIKLVEKDGVVTATVRAPDDADVHLRLLVPRSLAALTVEGTAGKVRVDGVPGRVAVVNAAGEVTVRGAGDLRLANVVGDVVLDGITGAIVTDGVVGRVTGAAVANAGPVLLLAP